jgi:hypothetical protein
MGSRFNRSAQLFFEVCTIEPVERLQNLCPRPMKETDPPSMDAHLSEVVIPKENAVFRMDGRGRWQGRHGPFEHKRIIDYFNRAIRRDADGYYVTQVRDNIREKVYFAYEDTPLFVIQVIAQNPIRLLLNTTETIPLDPARLLVEADQLYQLRGDERIKFSDRALIAMAPYLNETKNGLSLRMGDRSWPIANRCPRP